MKIKMTTDTLGEMQRSTFGSLAKIRRHAAAFIVLVSVLVGFGFARTTVATPLVFTLTGVLFNDGATASGYFVLDHSTGIYGDFSITTSGGTGAMYSPAVPTDPFYLPSPDTFIFDNFPDFHYLVLAYSGHIVAPGVYALAPGVGGPGFFVDSGERVSDVDYRLLTAGFLTVSTVPETGGTLLSLTIGIAALSGLQFFLRRQRTRA